MRLAVSGNDATQTYNQTGSYKINPVDLAVKGWMMQSVLDLYILPTGSRLFTTSQRPAISPLQNSLQWLSKYP